MDNIYLIPARDAAGKPKRVPDPQTGAALPAQGAFKERSQYWLRRLAQNDVSQGAPPAPDTFGTDSLPAPARAPRANGKAKAAAAD